MKTTILTLFLALSGSLWAVAAPTGLGVTPWSSNQATLTWNDAAVSQWQIFYGGTLKYSPLYQETVPSGVSRRSYVLQIAQFQLPVVVTMRALAASQPPSAESSAVTVAASADVDFTYVANIPGQALTVTGSFTAATGAAATAISATVTSDISSASATRNTALGSISTSAGLSAGFLTGSAATSALQTTGNTSAGLSAGFLTGSAATSALQTTGNTSAGLSAGFLTGSAATSALQTTGNTSAGLSAGFLTGSAATSALQTTGNTSAGLSAGFLTGSAATSALQTTGNTSAGLSAGFLTGSAATSALQTTGNTSLSNIYGQLTTTSNTTSQPVRLTYTPSVQGDVVSDGVDSGNPVKTGGQARTSLPTAVADADRVNATFDVFGRQLMSMSPRELVTQGYATTTGGAETTVLAAGGAGVFLDLTGIMAVNDSGTDVRLDIRDVGAGTIRFSIWLPSGQPPTFISFPVPIKQTTSNAAWTFDPSTAVTTSRVFMQAIQNK